jgi:arylsulfatase A-like enzyme
MHVSLRLVAALLLCLPPAACSKPATPAAGGEAHGKVADSKPRYDVLFLAIDDLRDWVGCLETGSGVQTPNIDRLAARGVLFRRAYCPAPLCNPSRAALLTGVPPYLSGVYSNDQDWRPRIQGAIALPAYFRSHGYRALGGGKLFHDEYRDDSVWDEYFEGGTSAQPPFDEQPLNGLELVPHFDWGPVDRGLGAMRDWRVADWARGKLAETSETPLFLGVGFYRPHLPWYAPHEFFERVPLEQIHRPAVREDDLEDVPAAGRALARTDIHEKIVAAGEWDAAIRAYVACIELADHCAGRVLDALDASPRRDRTIVVLWSDHGWHLGEKSHWRKSTLWEEAMRVPLVVVVPGMTPAGAVCDRPVSLMDLYPTLVELCGLPPRTEIAGTSLVPLLTDPAAPWEHPALTTHGAGNFSVRTERWRYTRYADGSEELYDHDADPHEWTNLAGRTELAGVIEELRRAMPTEHAPDTGPDPKTGAKQENGDD